VVGGAHTGASTRQADPADLLSALSQIDPSRLDEAGALETITALERFKRAASAVQARLSVRVDELARVRQRKEGTPRERLGAGVGTQIALARMESPHRGGRDLGLAKALISELPSTLASMERGDISEWRATLVARETACLDTDTRRAIDERISGGLASWGDSQTVREVRRLTYATDPGAAVARHAQAVSDRRVTIRPAPDTMCFVTALLPAAQGVAAYASLVRDAARARATGDPRGKGEVMADTLVERLTGQTAAPDVPLEVEVVMPLDTLLGDGHTPAHLIGYGPLPAAQVRQLLGESKASAWVRRLFVRPDSGQLVAMDSRRRRFGGQLRHFVVLRDQFCRMPWCDAPIRHADHLVPHRGDGPTGDDNGEGLCEACNYAKEAPGWAFRAADDGSGHLVAITTPTGTRYHSRAPDPPGTGPALPTMPWLPEAPGVWSIRARAG
jgi:hypothetical protein